MFLECRKTFSWVGPYSSSPSPSSQEKGGGEGLALTLNSSVRKEKHDETHSYVGHIRSLFCQPA
jgi:hypothetical protein